MVTFAGIRIWVPRSEQLEASIVNSLSLPVFTQGFDIEDEQVTLKVIGALSRFENLDDLDEPSIRSIMTNRALRARLKEGVTSSDAQFELIRDEVVALHRQTMQQLRERDTALVTVKKELEQERLARIAREQELQERVRELKAASNAAEEAVTVASAKDAAAISLESENAILAERLAFTSFLLWYILLPALTGVAASIAGLAVITTLHPTLMPTATVLISGCLLLAPISISAAIAARSVSQTVALRHSKFARAFAWLGKKAVIAPVTLALTGVYQAGVWDALKASTGIGP